MENTSIRSKYGYEAESDDEFNRPEPMMNFIGMKKSTFARKYQTDVRAIERDNSEESSDI